MKAVTHFKNIDALRFFAFAKVYLLHIPIVSSMWWFQQIKTGGGIGVMFFFVLSGFLISWLLLNEKIAKGQINAKRFMMRRILRIWPVYFLVLSFVYFMPVNLLENWGLRVIGGYEPNWTYSWSFLENYNMLLKDQFPITTPLSVFWSLCIEEHFYIVWLIVMSLLPMRYIKYFLMSCFPISILMRWMEPLIWQNSLMYTNDLLTNLDLFAAGGLAAYVFTMKEEAYEKFMSKIPKFMQLLFVLFVLILVFLHRYLLPEIAYSKINLIRSCVYGIAFALLILMMVSKHSLIHFSEKHLFSKLGQLSYGLYVYHLIFIHAMMRYCEEHHINLNETLNITVFVLLNLILSIGLSYLSKKYFEDWFLGWKRYFNP
ncbi:MAG: acyltransferase family protein [Bacteroidia bacterium]